MISFWFNLFFLGLTWGLGLLIKTDTSHISALDFGLSAVFFSVYFSCAIIKNNKIIMRLTSMLLDILVFVVFIQGNFNSAAPLIFIILTYVSSQTNDPWGVRVHIFFQSVLMISVIPRIGMGKELLLVGMMMTIAYTWIILTDKKEHAYIELNTMYDTIQSDYRRLKRHSVIHEKALREEERKQIAREIHDSVGHRLTALLMQLEVLRMQTEGTELNQRIQQLKTLAQESLSETREAVKTLKHDETTGLNAVIQLIRKLESESHLEITFQVKAGALSFPLSSSQSVILYRCIQESLTNMMRHAQTRIGHVEFSLIGEQFFRFQVSNPLDFVVPYQEGFGLTSMRERLLQIQGTLTISQTHDQFIVSGVFPMEKEV